MGRPEVTGFPSPRNLGQPDTLPQSPCGHRCEPDREHSSLIEAQIGSSRGSTRWGRPPPGSLPAPSGQAPVGAKGSSRIQTLRRLEVFPLQNLGGTG